MGIGGSLNGQTGTCLDKIPNCAAYAAEVCTTASYRLWATDNCADHCNLCGEFSQGSLRVNNCRNN
ncbi:hypothetical protein DPMN_081877 [Dreissena polymorpha]|uniref:ShKT domain-containing protein n=1 Tax=Dreissena polymorpha TaxID=45954 RepID=A0A9D3Y738_DREPO|nr:hypothetical protein DPMN_081877 [Dreissena polymorpha]